MFWLRFVKSIEVVVTLAVCLLCAAQAHGEEDGAVLLPELASLSTPELKAKLKEFGRARSLEVYAKTNEEYVRVMGRPQSRAAMSTPRAVGKARFPVDPTLRDWTLNAVESALKSGKTDWEIAGAAMCVLSKDVADERSLGVAMDILSRAFPETPWHQLAVSGAMQILIDTGTPECREVLMSIALSPLKESEGILPSGPEADLKRKEDLVSELLERILWGAPAEFVQSFVTTVAAEYDESTNLGRAMPYYVKKARRVADGQEPDTMHGDPPPPPLHARAQTWEFGILSGSDASRIYPTAPDVRSLDPDNAEHLEKAIVKADGQNDTPREAAISACEELENNVRNPKEIRRWASVRRLCHLQEARRFAKFVTACHAWLDRYPAEPLGGRVKGRLVQIYKDASRDTLPLSWNERLAVVLELLAPHLNVSGHAYHNAIWANERCAEAVERLRQREASDLSSKYNAARFAEKDKEREDGRIPEKWAKKYRELDQFAIETEQMVIGYNEQILELLDLWEQDPKPSSSLDSTRAANHRRSVERTIESRRKRIKHLRGQSYGTQAESPSSD